MKGIIKRLPESEEMVMSAVWAADKASAPSLSTVMDFVQVEYGKDWKPQTVSTFLSTLVRRGFLTSYRKGRYTYYEPAVSKAEYVTAEITRMAAVFCAGNKDMLIKLGSGKDELC